MDISREYVRMCEKAKEIQKLARDFEAVFVLNADNQIFVNKYGDWLLGSYKPTTIWLPRQDQLQEIVAEGRHIGEDGQNFDLTHPNYFLNIFHSSCQDMEDAGLNLEIFTSMEQLWLAFAMWERHHKKWDGERWINEEN